MREPFSRLGGALAGEIKLRAVAGGKNGGLGGQSALHFGERLAQPLDMENHPLANGQRRGLVVQSERVEGGMRHAAMSLRPEIIKRFPTRAVAQTLVMPWRMANFTSAGRSSMPSFAISRLRYVSTLFDETPSIAAASLLVCPSTMSFRTWRSRGLRRSSGWSGPRSRM